MLEYDEYRLQMQGLEKKHYRFEGFTLTLPVQCLR